MAMMECHFFSTVLERCVAMNVILPEVELPTSDDSPKEFACLYLLHGRSDDHSIWHRRTSVERYVEGRQLAVIMPNVDRSYYSDMVHGYRYWTFISEELPARVRSLFRVSSQPKRTFVAGLSMGGYGAFKLALTHPNRFAAAGSFSGAIDLVNWADRDGLGAERDMVYGTAPIAGSANDLFALAKTVASRGACPKLYQWCGTEDFLYADNVRFRDHARSCGLPLTYDEGPGDHNWACWDRQIEKFVEWMGSVA